MYYITVTFYFLYNVKSFLSSLINTFKFCLVNSISHKFISRVSNRFKDILNIFKYIRCFFCFIFLPETLLLDPSFPVLILIDCFLSLEQNSHSGNFVILGIPFASLLFWMFVFWVPDKSLSSFLTCLHVHLFRVP